MSIQIQSKVKQVRKCGNPACRQPGDNIKNCNHETAIRIKTEFEEIARFSRTIPDFTYLKWWLNTLPNIDLIILGGTASIERDLNIHNLLKEEHQVVLTFLQNFGYDTSLISSFMNERRRRAISSFTQEEIDRLTQQLIARGYGHLIPPIIVKPTSIHKKFPLINLIKSTINPLRPSSTTNSNPIECPICFDELPMGSDAVMAQCGHIYCSPCINTFIKHSVSSQSNKEPCCAMCRADITQLTFNKYPTFTNFVNTYH